MIYPWYALSFYAFDILLVVYNPKTCQLTLVRFDTLTWTAPSSGLVLTMIIRLPALPTLSRRKTQTCHREFLAYLPNLQEIRLLLTPTGLIA